jgi:quinone-modifying oxidoreductase subunit QmoA
MADAKHTQVMVVGGGIAGVTTAVEIAEMGYEVILVEKSPSLGGRVARMNKYFPKLCPPWCGLEINYRRVKDAKNLRVLTLAEVTKISGEPRNFEVSVKLSPRFVNPKNEQFDKAIEACEVEVADEFNLGMGKTKAISYYNDLAFPRLPLVYAEAKDDPAVAKAIADSGLTAFDLTQTEQELTFKVGAIVWATGWRPYAAENVTYLGYEKYQDVIQNVEMERLCAPSGPTAGKLLRPSDGKEAKRVAFLQCSGSRDANYLPYCSGVCCLASMKQATYVREQYPDSEAWMFYIDIRSDRYYDFQKKVEADEKIHLVKGKAGLVSRDNATGDMLVTVEDVATGKTERLAVDLVVLATGMVPQTADAKVPYEGVEYDQYGFITSDPAKTGIFPVGVVHKPLDVSATVQEATGVSIKAIQTILGG